MVREQIGGVPIRQLVETYGTPLYVYDLSVIERQLAQLAAFDIVRYAQKACSNLTVLRLLRERGALTDAVSAGELRRAELAGYPLQGDPPPVVFTADLFERGTLELIVEQGVHANLGSPHMVAQLGERAPGREVTLRINPGFGHGHSRKTNTGGTHSKHGIWHEDLESCLLTADRNGLAVSGLHMHIGSGADLDHLSQVCRAMRDAAMQVGRSVKSISAGGGLPVPYAEGESPIDVDGYFERWDATRRELEGEFGHSVRLEIEPGRFLVAESGFLICEIRAIKQAGPNVFYLVDAGFTHLARPILYGAYHPMSLCAPFAEQRSMQEVLVGGPLCESGDIFTQDAEGIVRPQTLPKANVGELLVIERTGAYGATMASNYNSLPLAAEVVIRNGTPELARRRQTIDEMLAGEIVS
ncbi:MAG: diaminopimelate decarboxylase [Planctomycetales bacterium]|nr:diaminopimelate decarboxylase [Planctomycetales bacterium]